MHTPQFGFKLLKTTIWKGFVEIKFFVFEL
jgi:hypothetical protein